MIKKTGGNNMRKVYTGNYYGNSNRVHTDKPCKYKEQLKEIVRHKDSFGLINEIAKAKEVLGWDEYHTKEG